MPWVKEESGGGGRLTACPKGLFCPIGTRVSVLQQARLNTGCWNTEVSHCFTQLGLGTETQGILGRDPEKLLCSQFCHCQTARKTTQQPGKPRQPSPTRRAWSVSPAPSLSAASVTPTLHLEETPSLPPTPSPPPVSQSPASTGGPRECSVLSPGLQRRAPSLLDLGCLSGHPAM